MNNYSKEQAKKINESHEYILKSMSYIADVFESYEKTYYIASGTSLGWYRDCGLSPHANDVDFNLYITEFDSNLFNAFIGHDKKIKLLLTFGSPGFGLEMRLQNNFQYDLFFVYPTNQTHFWVTYYAGLVLYK